MTTKKRYSELVRELREQANVAAALHLLGWDQETYMAPGVVEGRARQIGTLAHLLHERETAPAFLDLVDELTTEQTRLAAAEAVDVRETKWRLDRKRNIDAALVRERSELHARARAVWIEARRADDFAQLAPLLQRILELEKRVAAIIDPAREPYDVMLEGYEPGTSAAAVQAVFAELRDGLSPLVHRLRARLEASPLPDNALRGNFPIDAQRRFNRVIAEKLGFDFQRGRLDEAVHPFTASIGGEVRLTTRYDDGDLCYSLYSTIHETGHGLYEQGLDQEAWGLPRGSSCSLGIHESQSRLWENQVGRSRAFWTVFFPLARKEFPDLAKIGLDRLVLSVNEAQPSLIRTEADEITYNLHIILRFELERALVGGRLRVADLPEAWNEHMQRYLGVAPKTDREGVLQDVHWASGAVGYFPTYALGNICAAQLVRAAEETLGCLSDVVGRAEFPVLLQWLRTRVHRHGRRYRAAELMKRATGTAMTPAPLLEHLENKVRELESA
jgi:carboxypeptidase Taq